MQNRIVLYVLMLLIAPYNSLTAALPGLTPGLPTDTAKVSINDLNTAIRAFNLLDQCEALAASSDSLMQIDSATIAVLELQRIKDQQAIADLQAIQILEQQKNVLLGQTVTDYKKRANRQTIKAIVLPVAVGVIAGAAGVAVGRFVRW